MNIDDVVRIHDNIQKWLFPEAFLEVIDDLAAQEEIKKWSKSRFRKYIVVDIKLPRLGALFRNDPVLSKIPLGKIQDMVEPRNHHPELWDVTNTIAAYFLADLNKLRTIKYEESAIEKSYIGTRERGEDADPVLLAMLNIKPELEKRDEELSRVFSSFYDIFTSRAQKECEEIAQMDAIQILRKLPEFVSLEDPRKGTAYGWGCILDKDEVKAAMAPMLINGQMRSEFGRMVADRWYQAVRDSSSKDKAVSRYVEENRGLSAEAERLRISNKALASERDSLSSKVKALEARPQTIVPVDAAQLQKELETAREYENLFNLSDAENKDLKARVQALEGQLAGITAQAQQRRDQENGAYESFALYTAREGYDADLAAAILRSNSKFRSNNMVPRSMMRKNAENALPDKLKIKDFDKTLKWLTGLKVYNQKGDAFSTTINFSEIPVSDVRMYVSMLVSREA